ncbi:MAG: hypothetical protein ACKN9I_06605, partial [Alphaproteobacteria bacterium]
MLNYKLQSLEFIVENALNEDRAFDDITSDMTILSNDNSHFAINAREELIFCGSQIVDCVFKK